MTRTGMSMVLGLLVLGLPGRGAVADSSGGKSRVAILPLAAVDDHMGMYGKPVANALAKSLAARDEVASRLEVVAVASPQDTGHAGLVVNGRIVSATARRVILEAQVRDPERGAVLATVATRPAPLTVIDELTEILAKRLAPALLRAKRLAPAGAAKRLAPAGAAKRLAPAGTAPVPGRVATTPDAATTRAPRLAVFTATGQAAGGVVPVQGVATSAGRELAVALGFEPVDAAEPSLVQPERAVAALERARARLGLMIHIKGLEFAWSGVLLARGTVRVVVIDDAGRALYDRALRTDTLVGSRGDRHSALVRFVMVQVQDMVLPELSRWLGPRGRMAAGDQEHTAEP